MTGPDTNPIPVIPGKPPTPWAAIAGSITFMLALAVLLGVLLNNNTDRVFNPVPDPPVAAPTTTAAPSTRTPDDLDAVCQAMRDRDVRDVLLNYDFPVATPEDARVMVEKAVTDRCPEFREETFRRLAG